MSKYAITLICPLPQLYEVHREVAGNRKATREGRLNLKSR